MKWLIFTVTVLLLVTVAASGNCKLADYPQDCLDILNQGGIKSGVYIIKPDHLAPFEVYCDMETNGGGWTVFQRRHNGSLNFFKSWYYYARGFGNVAGEFWLGLDRIHRLTAGRAISELRVDMEDFESNKRYAQYSSFRVANAYSKYKLDVSGYAGTAGDSMTRENKMPFSTYDQDNDEWSSACAITFEGAWWYKACHLANLNGRYLNGPHTSYANGINWQTWRGYHYSLKFTEMKLRAI